MFETLSLEKAIVWLACLGTVIWLLAITYDLLHKDKAESPGKEEKIEIEHVTQETGEAIIDAYSNNNWFTNGKYVYLDKERNKYIGMYTSDDDFRGEEFKNLYSCETWLANYSE